MKHLIPIQNSGRLQTLVDPCLPRFGRSSSRWSCGPDYCRLLSKAQRSGYTLMEVLAASAVIAVGMTAMASLSGTLMLQEEMSWRVAVVRNYQENMARVWQMGIDQRQVMNLMPAQSDNTVLNQIINGTPSVIQIGTTTPSGLGTMQAAAITAAVNISQDPAVEKQGASLTLSVYRPSLPTSLRPVTP